MKEVIDCIKKYIEIIYDEKFIVHWKRLSEKLLDGIQKGYKNGLYEPDIVKIIEYIINSIGQFSTGNNRFNISTASIFIHGNNSQVEFKYYKKNAQRELGDIIFILSVVYNGEKFFEKMTINQIKKSKNVSWNFSSESAKEQLYLLSRFPTFQGVKGSLIPMKKYDLPNYSDCLGTHGLLYSTGDFALISSKQLEAILAGRNNLKLENLLRVISDSFCFPCCYLFNKNFEDCLYILHKIVHFFPECFRYPFFSNLPIFGNHCISYNAYDFSDKYLRGNIGELIYAKKLPYNKPAFQFLQDLLCAIKNKAKRKQLKNVLEFLDSFYHYKYGDQGYESHREENNYEGGGIGIIHTTVSLNKSKKID